MKFNKFSPVVAGTMKWGSWGAKFNADDYLAMIRHCIACGVTTFDHADIYGHYSVEEEFGKALKLDTSLRSKIQLISKCGIMMLSPNRKEYTIKHYDTSAAHIRASVERSLINLYTDYLDVLLLHRPDPLMDAEEVCEIFTALKKEGKVLDFGVSNFTVSQVALIHAFFPIITNQVEISIITLEPFLDGTLDQCQKAGIIPMAWSPLGGGNIFNSTEERDKRIVAVAQILASKYNCSPSQILLTWLLQHPAKILPVLGTAKADRIKEAVDAVSLRLTREEWFMLWRASTGKEVA